MGRKSAKIAGKKGAADRARSLIYTKALKEVTISAKNGGPDIESNFSLKVAIDRCKKANVPKDNIDRAIKKGMGNDQADWKDVNYEGYGPDGIAIFVEAATDNVTRTIANVRSYFNKKGGSLGKEGCLQFVFERKAMFTVKAEGLDPDELMMELIDAGAEEVEKEDDEIIIQGEVESFGAIYNKLEEMGIEIEDSALERLPLNTKPADSKETYETVVTIVELCEDDDDVSKVYHNMDYSEEFSE
jgi:YebC/PmpR family DNA-binding regulatory protein